MHAAYEVAGVGPSGSLLAPAYHCRTMLDPALALSGSVFLYPVGRNLTPQLADIHAMVAKCQPRVKALVVPHYFGFEQPQELMDDLAALCSLNGITLVEDCSHSWQIAIKRIRQYPPKAGHVLIGSPYKFFACDGGGTLWSNSGEFGARNQQTPGLIAEIKALRRMLQSGWSSQRGSELILPQAPSFAADARHGKNIIEYTSSPSRMYDERYSIDSGLSVSRWVMRHTAIDHIVKPRRANYLHWIKAVAKQPKGSALFPELPADCAPYMFPLLIEPSDLIFFRLKKMGVPIWRWDEMAVSDCPVSEEYSTRLLHLPCHQSLSASQMKWMTAAVLQVLA
jgi:perosamine synthetase